MGKYNIGDYVIYDNRIHRIISDVECRDCCEFGLDGYYGHGRFLPDADPPHPGRCYKIRGRYENKLEDIYVGHVQFRKAEPVEIFTLLENKIEI